MSNTRFKEFVDTAAAYFESESVYHVPQDLPVNYFPIRFSPYLRQDAIIDTMIDSGLVLHQSSGIRLMAFHALKTVIDDCESKEKQRQTLAQRLNDPVH